MCRFGNGVACSLMMSMVLRAEACVKFTGQTFSGTADVFSGGVGFTLEQCLDKCHGESLCAWAISDGNYCETWSIAKTEGDLSLVAQYDAYYCAQAPTPAPSPQAGSMSGDPIVSVNGLRVKFDLPSGQTTLMWGADDLDILSKANVVTPDKQSQWFSDFILVVNGHQAAHIQRNKIKVTSKEMSGMLNTLSLTTLDEAGYSHAVSSPGSYPVGNGTVNIVVQRDGARVGPLPREVVSVTSNSISCSISAERAKKFGSNEEKALQYSHLDIMLHKMSQNVKSGIFAELWGFIPMSSKTARMIRRVTVE